VRADELDRAWEIFTPILHYIEHEKPEILSYPYGSRGPSELNDFIKKQSGYSRNTAEQNYTWPTTDLGKL